LLELNSTKSCEYSADEEMGGDDEFVFEHDEIEPDDETAA